MVTGADPFSTFQASLGRNQFPFGNNLSGLNDPFPSFTGGEVGPVSDLNPDFADLLEDQPEIPFQGALQRAILTTCLQPLHHTSTHVPTPSIGRRWPLGQRILIAVVIGPHGQRL